MNKKYLKEKQDREIEMVLVETSSMQVWLFEFGTSMATHDLSSCRLDPVASSILINNNMHTYDNMHVLT